MICNIYIYVYNYVYPKVKIQNGENPSSSTKSEPTLSKLKNKTQKWGKKVLQNIYFFRNWEFWQPRKPDLLVLLQIF